MVVRPSISRRSGPRIRAPDSGVETRGRLVEDEDRRVPDHRPGDREPLALAAREQTALLADHACRSPRAAPR